jgi:hypothetical protein
MLFPHQIDRFRNHRLLRLRSCRMHCPVRLSVGSDRQLLDVAEGFAPLRFIPPAAPTITSISRSRSSSGVRMAGTSRLIPHRTKRRGHSKVARQAGHRDDGEQCPAHRRQVLPSFVAIGMAPARREEEYPEDYAEGDQCATCLAAASPPLRSWLGVVRFVSFSSTDAIPSAKKSMMSSASRFPSTVGGEVLHHDREDLLEQVYLGLVVYLHLAHGRTLPESSARA